MIYALYNSDGLAYQHCRLIPSVNSKYLSEKENNNMKSKLQFISRDIPAHDQLGLLYFSLTQSLHPVVSRKVMSILMN